MPRRKGHGIPPTKRVKQPSSSDITSSSNPKSSSSPVKSKTPDYNDSCNVATREDSDQMSVESSPAKSENTISTVTHSKYLHKKFKKMATAVFTPEENVSQFANTLNGSRVKGVLCSVPSKVLDSEKADQTKLPNTTTSSVRVTSPTGGVGGRYVCPYCKLACAKPSVLQKHIRAHTNERPYPCLPCGFAFKTKSNLYKHCRSRAHALKMEETGDETGGKFNIPMEEEADSTSDEDELQATKQPAVSSGANQVGVSETSAVEERPMKTIYKPKFHTASKYLDKLTQSVKPEERKENTSSPPHLQLKILTSTSQSILSTPSPFSSGSSPSPEFLHRHINKLISENQAIVETMDPFWPKKFLQRTNSRDNRDSNNSPASPLSSSSSPTDVVLPKRYAQRQSNVGLDGILNLQENSGSNDTEKFCSKYNVHSKLALALLRPQVPTSPRLNSSSPVDSSLDSQPLNLTTNSNKNEQPPLVQHHNRKRCYSEGFPNVRSNRDKITNLPLRINNNNQANLDHGKLNFISSDTNFPAFFNNSDGKKSSVNPQNPEGSIIKDLLLKARVASAAGIPIITSGAYGAAVGDIINNVKSGNFLLSVTPPVPDDRAYSPSNQFMCHLCKVPYRSAENLEIHQLYYCKGSEVITRSPLHSPSPQTAEVLQIQVPAEYSSKTNPGSSRKEYSSVRRGEAPMLIAPSHPSPGPLLGNTPLVESYHTKIRNDHDMPPIKKQKFEEITHSASPELRTASATTLRSLEELSKCPMRTNTLQMFGGEVKILDNPGGETKTMRIEPLNRATPQTPTDLSLNIPSQSSGANKSFSKEQNESKESCPQIVVTIAKTGLHSGGGTIVQVPQKMVATEGIQQQMSGCTVTSALSPHGIPSSNYTEQNKLIIPIIPNIVAPNLSIPGIPAPVQLPFVPFTSILTDSTLLNPLTNITAYNPLTLPPASLLCQPTAASPYTGGIVTILHGGKEIPYVPGMPGPHTLVTANPSLQPFSSNKAPEMQRLHESGVPSKSSVPIISHDIRSVPTKSEKIQNNSDVSKSNQSGVSVLKVRQPTTTLNIPSIQLTADTESPVEQTNSSARKRSHDETVVRTVVSPKLVLNRKNVHSPVVGNEATSVANFNEDTGGSDRMDTFNKAEKRFLRPTSLPLKPGTYTPKRQLSVSNNVLSLVSPETPRPCKSYGQLYLNGHAYTYLGLKCSTRMFFCTLNKPQPIYVPLSPEHNKVSMYSNWKVCSEADPNPFGLDPGKAMAHYDSRHRPVAYTLARSKSNDAVTHSTYWSNRTAPKQPIDTFKRDKSDSNKQDSNSKSEAGTENNVPKRVKIFVGGFESNEDYIYVRGRGRGRYVCEECGIRCKKPSMLKKHIRTHTDVRPFTCVHCKFSFKTKGNLTKHMKSKAHYKKCIELGITPVPTVVDDSCVDETILAHQQALRAVQGYDPEESEEEEDDEEDDDDEDDDEEEEDDVDEWKCRLEREAARSLLTLSETIQSATQRQYANAGLVALSARPNTYPYSFTMCCTGSAQPQTPTLTTITAQREREKVSHNTGLAREVHSSAKHTEMGAVVEEAKGSSTLDVGVAARYYFPGDRRDSELDNSASFKVVDEITTDDDSVSSFKHSSTLPMDLSNKTPVDAEPIVSKPSVRVCEAAMLLATLCSTMERLPVTCSATVPEDSALLQAYLTERAVRESRMKQQQYKVTPSKTDASSHLKSFIDTNTKSTIEGTSSDNIQTEIQAKALTTGNSVEVVTEIQPVATTSKSAAETVKSVASSETDNAALSTAKESALNVLTQASSDVRKLPASSATTTTSSVTAAGVPVLKKLKAEFMPPSSGPSPSYVSLLEDGRSMCVICNKVFTKPSQLRLHVNIHYFERPFRCESCAVSFRTNGHLQKHQRSVSHLNKVSMNSTFGTATTTNPRPFKCDDCKIAFRIHGHLAKHLRSKMHIMKLECLGKLPFGTYAEMERSGINMNDIDTTDCENSLESLQLLAQKLYEKDPSKLGQWDPLEMMPQLNQQLSSGDTSDEDDEGMACMSPPADKNIEQPTAMREQVVVPKTMMISPVLRYQTPVVQKQMFVQQQPQQQRNVEPVKYIMNLNNSAQVFRHKSPSVSNVVLLTDTNDIVGHAQFSKTETGNQLVVSSNSGHPSVQNESGNNLVIATAVSESATNYEERCSAAAANDGDNQRTAGNNESEPSVTDDDNNSVQLKQSLGELETSAAENQNSTTMKNENVKTKDIRSYECNNVDGKTD